MDFNQVKPLEKKKVLCPERVYDPYRRAIVVAKCAAATPRSLPRVLALGKCPGPSGRRPPPAGRSHPVRAGRFPPGFSTEELCRQCGNGKGASPAMIEMVLMRLVKQGDVGKVNDRWVSTVRDNRP